MMKMLILTQNENVYLPKSFATVCQQYGKDISCIVIAPAMSTHGGPVKGLLKHVALFGWVGTAKLASAVLWHKLLSWMSRPTPAGPFHSIPNVARAFDIPLRTVEKLKSDQFFAILDEFQPELLISISCPQIVGKKIRDRFPRGCINVHGAPLPKYRGLMPAFWALKHNESETAVTVHDLADKLDNGDILVQYPVTISPQDTWDSLVRKTKKAGAEALVQAIRQVENGTVQRKPNLDEEATYFSFPTAADRREFLAAGRRFF